MVTNGNYEEISVTRQVSNHGNQRELRGNHSHKTGRVTMVTNENWESHCHKTDRVTTRPSQPYTTSVLAMANQGPSKLYFWSNLWYQVIVFCKL